MIRFPQGPVRLFSGFLKSSLLIDLTLLHKLLSWGGGVVEVFMAETAFLKNKQKNNNP